MAAVIGQRRRRRPGGVEARAERRRDRTAARTQPAGRAGCGSEPTLETKLLTTWAALVAGYPVECPVCGGPLTASDGCSRCGSRLT